MLVWITLLGGSERWDCAGRVCAAVRRASAFPSPLWMARPLLEEARLNVKRCYLLRFVTIERRVIRMLTLNGLQLLVVCRSTRQNLPTA
jgi:hypothetical protein